MRFLQNLHTHSTFCDEKNTPEETVQKAIESGFDSIGFSGHCFMPYAPDARVMSEERTLEYINEINRLKAEYRDRIKIFLGIEVDMYAQTSTKPFDHSIGTVHYLDINGEKIPLDRDYLNCYFNEAEELLRSQDFKEHYILTDSGFVPMEL